MQPTANVTSGDVRDWPAMEWKRVYRTVKNLRQRLFRASRAGDLRRVRSLQRLLRRGTANVWESVRRVTQVHQGKRTAGGAGRHDHAEERGAFWRKLHYRELHQVHPVRRVSMRRKRGNGPSVCPPSKIVRPRPGEKCARPVLGSTI